MHYSLVKIYVVYKNGSDKYYLDLLKKAYLHFDDRRELQKSKHYIQNSIQYINRGYNISDSEIDDGHNILKV